MEPSSSSTVSDLSLTGFRIRTHMKFTSGSDISLTLPGLGARWAKVAWVPGFEAGCSFDEPLHQAVLDDVLRRANA
ncbi:PilZ domain-containing protein [Sphingobium sp. EP60837]|uniref:PilZ domain-containing protein n=1 Tax=Sphingobium sp. EP60837 TaxID=1855519 RepID=UPI003FA78592